MSANNYETPMDNLWLSAVVLFVMACQPTSAEKSELSKGPTTKQTSTPVTAQMLTTVDTNGERWAGVLFTIDKGWHIYGKVSGDSGLPTRVRWQLPKSVSASEVHYPPPKRFSDEGDIVTYGYSDEVLLLSKMTFDKSATWPVSLGAKATWLACQPTQCIPGEAELRQVLPAEPAADAKTTALFQRYKPAAP